jgi:ATP-dependent DNA helicase RecG
VGRPPRSFAGSRELSRAELLAAPVHWPRPSALDVSIQALEGVGPKLAEAAAEAGIETVGDVLLRFPHRHRDRTIRPLAEVGVGETGTVLVEVLGSKPRPFRKGRISITSVKVGDESGHVRATWFNQPWVAGKLEPGTRLLITGKRSGKGFGVNEYEIVAGPRVLSQGEGGAAGEGVLDPPPPGPPAGGALVPVHPATEALKAQKIREWAEQACRLASNAIEGLPAELRVRRGLAGVGDAIRAAHFPEAPEEAETALKRIAFEELFLHQALLTTRKRSHRTARPAPRLGQPGERVGRWLETLPFEPTADQLRSFDEIDADLDSGEPMQRLLMGEVGSGKTVVAVYAMLRALEAGYQAALMAPTEVLAEQHAITLGRLLAAEAIPFALVTGSTPAPRRRQALNQLATGELGLILGTHALIEPDVQFARLGLCVVDEQHRFGVQQRRALDSKGVRGMAPHVLHMTATPIPRTLALTVYGDLAVTEIAEPPASRRPIVTAWVGEERSTAAYERLRTHLDSGRQAYVVCPLIEASETRRARAAEEEAERLASGELAGYRVGLMHGRLKAAERRDAMRAFSEGELDVLVATTVIEVGVDVPNATIMIVQEADRFGLAQLHQLRGRVGRGAEQSYCLLVSRPKGELTDAAQARLQALVDTTDGFELAERDLELRGEGALLGTRQSGLSDLRFTRLRADRELLERARGLARELAGEDGPWHDEADRLLENADPARLA